MTSEDEPPSSPPSASASAEAALAYYKSQYEQLESELAEFQASSRELEAELEKDVEAAEKREHTLQQKVEGLGYEVEEWKTKYKQSKAEANGAQNTLQKEITTLRDSNRSMQLKLRDIEVANDDFERQARNTTSSLEDLESKYNVSIERGVMLEAEIQSGEQEREALRIASQRLREELSDLKIEAEINQDKLRHARPGSGHRENQAQETAAGSTRPLSPASVASPATTTSSPTVSTPPRPKSASTTVSETTPPSPPISDTSIPGHGAANAKFSRPLGKTRSSGKENNITPRPSYLASKAPPRHSRGPSLAMKSGIATPSGVPRSSRPRVSMLQKPNLPASSSLHHIRGLIGQMEKLEQRVHSARSKLPGPVHTPERASPRNGSALGHRHIPASVTMRSSKKRTGGSNASTASSLQGREDAEVTPLSTKHINRMSVGGPRPASPDKHSSTSSRPSSRTSVAGRNSINPNQTSNGYQRPSSRTSISHARPESSQRPSSRTSMSHARPESSQRPSSRSSISGARTPLGHFSTSTNPDTQRPGSRSSISGARTPLGHYSSSTTAESRRPRSSVGGNYVATHAHSHSMSSHNHTGASTREERDDYATTPTPRRTTLNKNDVAGTGIPTPSGISRRQSGGLTGGGGRRTSSGAGAGYRDLHAGGTESEMGPPERRRRLSGVGETY